MLLTFQRYGVSAATVVALVFLWMNSAHADEWAAVSGVVKQFHLVKVEPLIPWSGGAVRVVVDSAIPSTYCGGSSTVGDVLLGTSGAGTQESRSATLSAIYMALAANRTITLYLSTSSCSSGAPLVLGLDVLAN